MDLNLIRPFVIACEEGGVSAAAGRLKLPKSTVSRRLARLQEVLDAQLLERSGTGLVLTARGRKLYEDTRASIHALEPLEHNNRRKGPALGGFVIQVPRIFAEGVLNPILLDYLDANPGQTVEVVHGDRFTDSRSQSVDLFVKVGASLAQSADERLLMSVEARLYAAPKFFGAEPPPSTPAELEHWPYIALCTVAGVPERVNVENAGGKVTTIALRTRLASNELSTLIAAAERGLGIVQLPGFIGDRLVEEGRLVGVLDGYRTDGFQVSLSMPGGNRNPSARHFADHLEATLRMARPS